MTTIWHRVAGGWRDRRESGAGEKERPPAPKTKGALVPALPRKRTVQATLVQSYGVTATTSLGDFEASASLFLRTIHSSTSSAR